VQLSDTVPPITITGWVGVIIEKITAGYLDATRPTSWQ
jgi:hypothetical protein